MCFKNIVILENILFLFERINIKVYIIWLFEGVFFRISGMF